MGKGRGVAFVALAVLSATVLGQEKEEGVIERFLSSQNETLQDYRAIRHMEVTNERIGLSTLTAETSLLGKTLTYKVLEGAGSAYVRGKMLEVLYEEKKLLARGEDKEDFTRENYFFSGARETSEQLVELLVSPKHRDGFMIEGSFLVTPLGILSKSEGKLAKNPSFWIRNVRVNVTYRYILGARLPISLESRFDVRLFGKSTFSMEYDYQKVNGIPLPAVTDTK